MQPGHTHIEALFMQLLKNVKKNHLLSFKY